MSTRVLPPEYGIGVPVDGRIAMKRSETKTVVRKIKQYDPLDPRDVERFLRTDYNPEPNVAEQVTSAAVPVGSFGGSLYSGFYLSEHPQAGIGLDLPLTAHRFLNYVYGHLQTNYEAASPDILQHAPALLGAFAVGAVFNSVKNVVKKRSLRTRAQETKQDLSERIKTATPNWDLSRYSKPLVAYVGRSSLIAEYMAKEWGEPVVQVAYDTASIAGPTVALREKADIDEAAVAFERADVEHAQLVIFPGTEGYEVFPPQGDMREAYDSAVARAEGVIRRSCEVRISENKPLSPAVIVGNRHQPINYVASDPNYLSLSSRLRRKAGWSRPPQRISEDTLETHMQAFSRELSLEYDTDYSIQIIDPSLLVARQITTILKDRKTAPPLQLVGVEDDVTLFEPGFYDSMQELAYTPHKKWAPIKVVYNMSDRANEDLATSALTDHNDIFIVNDPARGDKLVEEGVPAQNVIVISRLVKAELEQLLQSTERLTV